MLDIHEDAITSAVFLPDGNQILTNSKDNTLKLIDVRTFQIIQTIEDHINYSNSGGTSNKVAVNSFGNQVLVPSSSGHAVAFDLDSGAYIRTLKND